MQSILQDNCGYLWIATQDGLNRFDGYTFTVYRRSTDATGLTDSVVWSLFRDTEGDLWVGTADGLNRFDKVTRRFIHFRHNPGDDRSLSNPTVRDIHEDAAGRFWVATDGGGLNRLDRDARSFVRYRHDPADSFTIASDELQTVFEDSTGRLWTGHYRGGGVRLLDRETERFSRITSLNDDFVRTIYEDDKGIIWFGMFVGGLSLYDPATSRFRHIQHEWWSRNSLSNNTVRLRIIHTIRRRPGGSRTTS